MAKYPPKEERGRTIREQWENMPLAEQAVGGRVRKFAAAWAPLGRTVHRWVSSGVRLPFVKAPPLGVVSSVRPSRSLPQVLEEELSRLALERVIELDPCPTQPGLVSPVFLIPKAEPGKFRLCHDLRVLNAALPKRQFRMEGWHSVRDALRPRDLLTKIDLRQAYHTIPMAEEHRRFLRFQWGAEMWRFRALPFGLSTAPWIFTMIMRAALSSLRRRIRLVVYLDDILVMSETAESAVADTQAVIDRLTELGFFISSKSILSPSTQVEFLGMVLNSANMTVSLPSRKAISIAKEARYLLRNPTTTKRKAASFIGKLTATALAVPMERFFVRPLSRRLHNRDWNALVSLDTPAARSCLRFWTECRSLPPAPLHRRPPPARLTTDASPWAWGAVLRSTTTGGWWSRAEATASQNQRELRAVLMALRSFTANSWHILTDNTTAVSYINRMGGRVPQLDAIARQIWSLALRQNKTLSASWIPGAANPADAPSRPKPDRTDYALSRAAFARISKIFFRPSIDLFASRLTAKTKTYVSRTPQPGSVATDAFSIDWPDLPLIFPPVQLVGKALRHFQASSATLALLIAPTSSRPWTPLLKQMEVRHVAIKSREIMFPRGCKPSWLNRVRFRCSLISSSAGGLQA